MINAIRRHWRRVKARVGQLLTKPDRESVEGLGVLALFWQVNRLALAGGWHALPTADLTGGGAIGASGRVLTDAGNAFWLTLVDQSWWFNISTVTSVLVLLLLAAAVGLVEEWTRVRLAASFLAAAWWLWSGAMLSFHTTGHLGGGLSLLWGLAAGWVFLGLNRRLEREAHRRRTGALPRSAHLEIGGPPSEGAQTRRLYVSGRGGAR